MTETTPPNPESATEQGQTIVHELWRGNICIELTGHLNIFVGHKQEHITPAMLALKSGVRPEKVIWEAFPNWQTLPWVSAGSLAPAPALMLTGHDGSHIVLGPAHGESTTKMDLIKAFHDWMLAWEAEERAKDCAGEDEHEDAAIDPVEAPRAPSTRYGLGFFVIAAVLLLLAYDAFKIFIPAEITKREPIGVLVSASSSDNWNFPWLLETDRGIYPVGKVLMADKGAPLTLIKLSNGMWAICDERLEVCARTVDEDRRLAITRGDR